MVEAGRQRDPRGRDPRRARHRPRRDPQDLRRPARAGREGRQAEAVRSRPPVIDAELVAPDRARATARSSTRPRRSRTSSPARTPRRPSRRRCSSRYSGDPGAETYGEYRRRAQLAFDSLEKSIIRERIAVHKRRPDGRAEREIRADLDRGRRRAAHARLRALHPRPDPGPERRRPRHAQGGDAPGHARPRDPEVLLAPLQLPALQRRARRASCAAPSAATSATAPSPSGRSCRWSRARRTSPTRSASCRTSSSPTARRRWPRSAAPRSR